MLLASELPQHQAIPKEYELDITSQAVDNTYVFTEQNLPGFKSKTQGKFESSTANMPARLNRERNQKERPAFDKNKRFQPYFRRAVPST